MSAVAVAACLSSMSPGVYIVLMNEKGDDVDKAGYAFISLVSLPFIPVCFLSILRRQWNRLVSVSVPAILASEHTEYLPYVETATAQIAMVVLLSTFMTPVFVKILDSKKA